MQVFDTANPWFYPMSYFRARLRNQNKSVREFLGVDRKFKSHGRSN